MKKLFIIVASLLTLLAPAVAQVPTNPGDPVSVTPGSPEPLNPKNWRGILAPQQCPNGSLAPLNTCGDGRDGFGRQWDSFSQRMELRPPKILYGPGAITSNTALTQNAWTNLYGAIGANGFRSGLTAYIPRGNYNGWGQIAVASGPTANSVYTVRVLMGTCLQTAGSQQGILTIPQVATNAATAAGAIDGTNNVLGFVATTCIVPGMVAYDVTHPGAIASQILVCSVTSTTIKLTSAAAYPSCSATGFVTAPGVSNGDTIMFGFVSGYGGPQAWPGGLSLPFTIPYFFTTASLQCQAVDVSNQQCEMLTQIYTTDSGAVVLSGSGQVTNPPYSTSFNIIRVDGGYGAQ
jgi:hypothetical protein